MSAVSGLPPQREDNGFGTDIEGYTPPPETPEPVDYYQTVTTGYVEAMGIPILRAARSTRRTASALPWRS